MRFVPPCVALMRAQSLYKGDSQTGKANRFFIAITKT